MKKNSIMVKQVLMSALTAGIFTFGFTSCADEDVMDDNKQTAEMAQAIAVSQDLPAETFEGDSDFSGYDDLTDIRPVIHTIDCNGTHRYYDFQGRQLKSSPIKGVYIDNGKKVIK